MAYKWRLLTTYIHWDDPPSTLHQHLRVNHPAARVKREEKHPSLTTWRIIPVNTLKANMEPKNDGVEDEFPFQEV